MIKREDGGQEESKENMEDVLLDVEANKRVYLEYEV